MDLGTTRNPPPDGIRWGAWRGNCWPVLSVFFNVVQTALASDRVRAPLDLTHGGVTTKTSGLVCPARDVQESTARNAVFVIG